jgi:hypothetical protein
VRADQSAGVARLRTDGAEDIEILVLGLLNRARAGANLGPHARDRAVLAETGLVLIVNQQTFVGVGCFE